ncbi:MAG: hypothetical protein C5B60_04720 [Chloroflexi bacterium]|nr:MAG: hypothetical protein C5B60_04720 [Chloroflexota bacterium]
MMENKTPGPWKGLAPIPPEGGATDVEEEIKNIVRASPPREVPRSLKPPTSSDSLLTEHARMMDTLLRLKELLGRTLAELDEINEIRRRMKGRIE